jgi:hypothetical protein
MSLRERPRLLLLEMPIADKIMNLLRRRPGLTAIEIAVNIFGRRHPYKQRVNHACRRLIDEGRLERRGKGGPGDPLTYYLSRAKRGDPHPAEEDWGR